MSEPSSPVIVFEVDLSLDDNIVVGPLTNERTTGILHADRFQSNADTAISAIDGRKNFRSTWIPGLANGNVAKKHGDRFTAYGQKAVYLKNTYTTGANPILKIISQS